MSTRRIAIGTLVLAAIAVAIGIVVEVTSGPEGGPPAPAATQPVTPEPTPAGSALDPGTLQAIETTMAEWVTAWRSVDTAFDLRAFRSTREGRIEYESVLPFKPGDPFFIRARMPDYAYSPDRTRFVDSYVNLDPDSAVAVVDLVRKTWSRLLFCGTPCGFDSAAWLSDDVLVVVGRMEPVSGAPCATPGSASCPTTPLLWLFDFSRNVRTDYEAPTAQGDISPTYTRRKVAELPAD